MDRLAIDASGVPVDGAGQRLDPCGDGPGLRLQPVVLCSTVISATDLAQLVENIGAASIELAPEVIEEIEPIHLRYTNPAS